MKFFNYIQLILKVHSKLSQNDPERVEYIVYALHYQEIAGKARNDGCDKSAF
jgi:hypothetical protein